MSGPTGDVVLERTIEAPPEDVYQAFTSSLGLSEWLGDDVRLDAREGGRLYVYWNTGFYAVGEFISLAPPTHIAFSWRGRGDPGPTRVDVSLEPLRSGAATRVVMEHSGVGADTSWEAIREAIESSWSRGLANLASVLEEGIDMRLYGRPMLGLAGGVEVTPELAAERGLPVERGVLMTDFVEGMGAHAAGLTRGDVLVRLGGVDVGGWESLAEALAAHEVGDTVPVTYFRGDRAMNGQLTLFGRPRPTLPATPAEAAAMLRSSQAELRSELEEAVAGASDERCQRRTDIGGWSASEVLAHLICTERALHMWLALRLQGYESSYWASNDDVLVRSLLAAHPTCAALLQELDRAREQTAQMVETLPTAFLDRRASFTTACDLLLLGLPYHTRSHIEQLRDALAEGERASPSDPAPAGATQ